VSPSEQFARSVAANLAYWRERLGGLSEPEPWSLSAERSNLYRAIDFGLELAETWRQAAELALDYAPLMENDGNWREWQPLIEQVAAGAPEDSLDICTKALNVQGYYYLLERRFEEALAVHRRQIRMGEALDLPIEIARGHYGMSHVYWRQRDYDRGREHGQAALTGFRAAGAGPTSQAHTLEMLGLIDQYAGAFESSARHLREAVALFRRVIEPVRLARSLKNLALTLEELGEIEGALEAYEEAADLLAIHANELERSLVELSRGTLYFNQDRLDEAEGAFRRANSAYMRRSGPRYYQAMLANNLANVYLARGELERAECCFEEAIDKWHEARAKVQLAMSLEGMAEVWQARGEPETARSVILEALAILDDFPQDAFAQKLKGNLHGLLGTLGDPQAEGAEIGAVG
jgi:tetratricopeptide (TPR) repeat protein